MKKVPRGMVSLVGSEPLTVASKVQRPSFEDQMFESRVSTTTAGHCRNAATPCTRVVRSCDSGSSAQPPAFDSSV